MRQHFEQLRAIEQARANTAKARAQELLDGCTSLTTLLKVGMFGPDAIRGKGNGRAPGGAQRMARG